MKNSQIVKEIIETLEREHLNLYHDISKNKLDKYIKSIEWDKLNEIEFDREMKKLFHQFKDAHTNYHLSKEKGLQRYKNKFSYINRKTYITIDNKYYEVLEINDRPIKDIIKNLTELIAYETEAWKCYNINSYLNYAYCFKMLGITDKNYLDLKIKRDDKISNYRLEEKTVEVEKNKEYYSYKLLDNNTIYLKYSECIEMKDYPFADFVKDIKKACKENNVENYIFDLRGNKGGDSRIIRPLEDLIEKLNLKGVVLIDNGVMSSGRIAVVDFKRRFNSTLIGQMTGGAVASYGYNKNLKVADKSFSCSIRYWDFSDVFDYSGSIKPDIIVVNGVKEKESGCDMQLEFAKSTFMKEQYLNLDGIKGDFKIKL